MKVCVISTPVFSVPVAGYSGLEVIAWECARGLALKGHEVSLVAPDGSTCPNVKIIPNGPAGTWDEKSAFGRYHEALKGFDVIIDHTWNKWSYVYKMQGGISCPVLGVCHAPINTMYQTLPNIEKPCFVCISKDQANHFEALFDRPAKVAYNGIDLSYYQPIAGLKRTNRYLFLARFSTIKGPHIAQEACRALGKELDLVGDTTITGEPSYFEYCKSLADGKQIRIVGPATRGECVYWMSQAHAFLHSAKDYREPFGLAPVEANACGLPVIAWNRGALRETIVHGKTGFIVNSVQEFHDVIKSNAVDTIDRDECRENAKRFSIENMVNGYESLCFEALETGGW